MINNNSINSYLDYHYTVFHVGDKDFSTPSILVLLDYNWVD